MNINFFNWKLNTVFLRGDHFELNFSGYSRSKSQIGKLTVNRQDFSCYLRPTSRELVPFAPIMDDIFLWSTSCLVPSTTMVADGENVLVFCVDDHQYPPLAWYKSAPKGLSIPPEENIKRVSGKIANRNNYVNSGRTEYLRYRQLFNEYASGKTEGVLLDWGVGCARVSQHFLKDDKFKVVGIDIDKVNIDWCTQNVPNLISQVVNLNPPTGLEADFFEIVISSSVLSHLIPENWHLWLAEISMILKQDGMAFLSFHGDNSCMAMLHNNKPAQQKLDTNGYLNLNGCADLGTKFEEYYRNTFFTDNYARKLLTQYFKVEAIVPGLLSGLQSVAVLRHHN